MKTSKNSVYKISSIDEVVPLPSIVRKAREVSPVRKTLESMRPGQHTTIKQKAKAKTLKRFLNNITHLCYSASLAMKDRGVNVRFLKVANEETNSIDVWCIAGKNKTTIGE